MTPFLLDIATELVNNKRPLERYTLVFPNRRAVLFFKKHLASLVQSPVFSPKLVTIEEFISGFSVLKVPDRLELVYRLYRTYRDLSGLSETFDQFYFWGDMLLRDFNDIDKYLVNAAHLFKAIANLKELDATFDYLTDEQKKFLHNFWSTFSNGGQETRKKFLEVWNQLSTLYDHYRDDLRQAGLAYEGMLHRDVAGLVGQLTENNEELLFIGFNALTKAEEEIIGHFVTNCGSRVYWDIDEYYLNSEWQEAGRFFRTYKANSVFSKTFLRDVPANFRKHKNVQVFGAPQPVAQAKLLGQVLEEELKTKWVAEETVVILPDEKLLLPVLHAVSGYVEELNVTMGFPLASTPMFNLIELAVELQLTRKGDHFHHQPVLALLGHAYGSAPNPADAYAKQKEILKNNRVFIPKNFLASASNLHRILFTEAVPAQATDYVRNVINCLGSLDAIGKLDKEYAYYFLKLINRLDEVLGKEYSSWQAFIKLFRQLVHSQRIPFSGEPLRGLQVMGMLETRNLDFKNVCILSLNEGALPAYETKGSYLPHSIRKAYALPTVDHQDAMYAYLFYRTLQRAENIFLFYNTETDVLGQGEMSRLLQQLIYESGLNPLHKILSSPLRPHPVEPIVIEKSDQVIALIAKINDGNSRFKGISPSALNAYLECRLQFYLKHIIKIREADEVEEDLDARVLGTLLHHMMEQFYKNLTAEKKSRLVEPDDFEGLDKKLATLLDQAFMEYYHLDPTKKVEYDGQRIIVREVVNQIARRILEEDRKYAPFTLEGTEIKGLTYSIRIHQLPGVAILGGTIDRVDRRGDVVRVIDYKTGRDKLDFESVESLFMRNDKRNKAAFQTLLYALLYMKNTDLEGIRVVPGLFNRVNLFEDDFNFGFRLEKEPLVDIRSVLPEFEARLKEVVEEIFDPTTVFDQTTDIKTCRFCPYKAICYR
jgi:hypothetical protein